MEACQRNAEERVAGRQRVDSPHVQGAFDDVGVVDYAVYVCKEITWGSRLIECRFDFKVRSSSLTGARG